MVRVHQFDKVELVQDRSAGASDDEHEAWRGRWERSLRRSSSRTASFCCAAARSQLRAASATTRKSGAPVSVPGSSVRRGSTSRTSRRAPNGHALPARLAFVPSNPHTLNASGVALPRNYAALIENHRRPTGWWHSTRLRPYLDGLEELRHEGRRVMASGDPAAADRAALPVHCAGVGAGSSCHSSLRATCSSAAAPGGGAVPVTPSDGVTTVAGGDHPPRGLARFCAQGSFPATRDPRLHSCFPKS